MNRTNVANGVEGMAEPELILPEAGYDVVGSIVLYKTRVEEVRQSIRQFLDIPLKTHLVVIDNSPEAVLPEGSPDADRVTYHFARHNHGYGRAHNIALRAAKSRALYSLIMNTDISYSPDVVLRLKDVLDTRPRAGLAAPRICNVDGSLQHVCRKLPTPANFFLRRFLPGAAVSRRLDDDYELRWWAHDSIQDMPYFQGSFLLVRTDLCNQLGGFDQRFFMYGEDIDLCRRMHAVGETLYVPDVSVEHEYRRMSSRGWRGTWIGICNNARYFNKWGWFFDAERRRVNRELTRRLKGVAG